MDTPSSKFAQSQLKVETTPSEIYESAYGELVPEIIRKVRKYQSENPMNDYMRTPDYSDASMQSKITVKPMGDRYQFLDPNALVERTNLPTIQLSKKIYGDGNNVVDRNLSVLMHELQHSIGVGDTPGTRDIGSKPIKTISNRDFLKLAAESEDLSDLEHALSPAELPAYISQLKLKRFQDTNRYPFAEDSEQMIGHLKELEKNYEEDSYIRDVIKFLQQSPESGMKFWNSVARRDGNLAGLLA